MTAQRFRKKPVEIEAMLYTGDNWVVQIWEDPPLIREKKALQLPHSKSNPLYIGKIREMTGGTRVWGNLVAVSHRP